MRKLNCVLLAFLWLWCTAGVSFVYAAKSDVAKHLFDAHKLFQKKKYDEAILYFKKAVAADPTDATLYYNIGVVYQLKGKAYFPLAKNWYEKALEKDRKLAFAHYNLGVMAFNNGNVDEARKFLETAKTLKPKDKGIDEALRETKKAQALVKETPAQTLTKTQKTVTPKVAENTENKEQTQPLTKVQKTTQTEIPAVTDANKNKNQTQLLTKTQKSVAPVKITEKKAETPKKDADSMTKKTKDTKEKKAEKGKNVTIKNVEKKTPAENKKKEAKPAWQIPVKTVVCADIKNRMPVLEKESFSPSEDKQIVVWLELKNMAGEHSFESRWLGPDGKLYSTGTRGVKITGQRYRTWFIRKLKGSRMGEKTGAWTVEIFIDKKLLKKVNFIVQ